MKKSEKKALVEEVALLKEDYTKDVEKMTVDESSKISDQDAESLYEGMDSLEPAEELPSVEKNSQDLIQLDNDMLPMQEDLLDFEGDDLEEGEI